MGNARPKGTSRFADDVDFGASFVLDRGDVEAALESESAEASSEVRPPAAAAAASRTRWIVAAVGTAAVLVVVALSLLGLS